jgi:hypothetical protein
MLQPQRGRIDTGGRGQLVDERLDRKRRRRAFRIAQVRGPQRRRDVVEFGEHV